MLTGCVPLTFTFARFSGVPDVFGIRVLGNPALYGVISSVAAIVVVSLATKTRGRVEEFMAITHRG